MGTSPNSKPLPEAPPLTPTQITALRAVGIGIPDVYAVSVKDPAVAAALTFLAGLGAPPPTSMVDSTIYSPTGNLIIDNLVTWVSPANPYNTVVADAGLLAWKPGEVALNLSQQGFLKTPSFGGIILPSNFKSGAIMPYQAAAYFAVPVATGIQLPPASPVGYPLVPGQTGPGSNFQVAATDSLTAHPIGSIWLEDGTGAAPAGEYLKTGTINLFGPSIMWTRQPPPATPAI